MKLLLTGATGVAGLAVYRAALNDPGVSKITLLLRREMPSWAALPSNAVEKTETIIVKSFTEYPPELVSRIAGHDACIWALGKSAAGMSEKEYTLVTYDYTMTAMNALARAGVGSGGKPFRFVYVSGMGADQTEKATAMWARVKGRTEKDLVKASNDTTTITGGGQIAVHLLRLGFFFPSLPADLEHQRSGIGRFFGTLLWPVVSTVAPNYATPLNELGTFALEIAKGRWPDERLVSNGRLRSLMRSLQQTS